VHAAVSVMTPSRSKRTAAKSLVVNTAEDILVLIVYSCWVSPANKRPGSASMDIGDRGANVSPMAEKVQRKASIHPIAQFSVLRQSRVAILMRVKAVFFSCSCSKVVPEKVRESVLSTSDSIESTYSTS